MSSQLIDAGSPNPIQPPDTAVGLYSLASPSDYFRLLKPRVMSLVLFTASVGAFLAPGTLHPFMHFVSLFCIAMGAGASGAINMWYERSTDALMDRTKHRPLPQGRLHAGEALGFGVTLALTSIILMGLALNLVAAGMLAFTIFFYVFIYTIWLKKRTPQNIVIGGAAGAFPPVVAWTAVTPDLSLEPTLLFLIIFMWTPPHFWALSLYRCDDYKKAGIPMLPVVIGISKTTYHMMIYTLLLSGVTLLPFFINMFGLVYFTGTVALNSLFIYYNGLVVKKPTPAHARQMFKYSLLYLALLYALMIADRLISL